MHNDINEGSFMEFAANETAMLNSDQTWLSWCKKVEAALGHDLDGDEDQDGYSLDGAFDAFCAGASTAEYIQQVTDAKFFRRYSDLTKY